jgi:predicted phosphoribosyltransferase
MAIGQFYQEFEQLEDEEVIRLLKTAWGEEDR